MVTAVAVLIPALIIAELEVDLEVRGYKETITQVRHELLPSDIIGCSDTAAATRMPNTLNMTTWTSDKRTAPIWSNAMNYFPWWKKAVTNIYADRSTGIAIPSAAGRDPWVLATWLQLTAPRLGGPTSWFRKSLSLAESNPAPMCHNSHFRTYFSIVENIVSGIAECGYDPLAVSYLNTSTTDATAPTTFMTVVNQLRDITVPKPPQSNTANDPQGTNCYAPYGARKSLVASSCGCIKSATTSGCMEQTRAEVFPAADDPIGGGRTGKQAAQQCKAKLSARQLTVSGFVTATHEMWDAAAGMAEDAQMTVTQAHTLMTHTCFHTFKFARQLSWLSNEALSTDRKPMDPSSMYTPVMGWAPSAIPAWYHKNMGPPVAGADTDVTSGGKFNPYPGSTDQWKTDTTSSGGISGFAENRSAVYEQLFAQSTQNKNNLWALPKWQRIIDFMDMYYPTNWLDEGVTGYSSYPAGELEYNLLAWCMSENQMWSVGCSGGADTCASDGSNSCCPASPPSGASTVPATAVDQPPLYKQPRVGNPVAGTGPYLDAYMGGGGWTAAKGLQVCLTPSNGAAGTANSKCQVGCETTNGINGCFWPYGETSLMPGNASAPIYGMKVPHMCSFVGGPGPDPDSSLLDTTECAKRLGLAAAGGRCMPPNAGMEGQTSEPSFRTLPWSSFSAYGDWVLAGSNWGSPAHSNIKQYEQNRASLTKFPDPTYDPYTQCSSR